MQTMAAIMMAEPMNPARRNRFHGGQPRGSYHRSGAPRLGDASRGLIVYWIDVIGLGFASMVE